MAALFAWIWFVGGVPAAVLAEVVRAENPRVARAGRIAFALLLGVDLLLAALLFTLGNAAIGIDRPTRSIWWVSIVLGGIPLALVSGLAVRRGYAGRRPVLAAVTLATAGLYLAFPLGFIPAGRPLTGLGRWEHDHHVLGVAILLIPSLTLLANELLWKRQETPDAMSDGSSLRPALRGIPRSYLIGGALVLAALIWIAGATGVGMVIGLGVIVAGSALFLWRRDRAVMRGVQADLEPSGEPRDAVRP